MMSIVKTFKPEQRERDLKKKKAKKILQAALEIWNHNPVLHFPFENTVIYLEFGHMLHLEEEFCFHMNHMFTEEVLHSKKKMGSCKCKNIFIKDSYNLSLSVKC